MYFVELGLGRLAAAGPALVGCLEDVQSVEDVGHGDPL
jgi:hypothetical protein